MALEIAEIVADVAVKDGVLTVNLPDGFTIDGGQAIIKKVGNELHVIPFQSPWEKFFKSTTKFTDDFMETRDQGEDQERESFD